MMIPLALVFFWLQDLSDDPNNELMIPEDPECNKEVLWLFSECTNMCKPKRIKADINILQHTLAVLLAVCLGGAVSLTFIVWIQIHKGWDWGFGIGTIAMLLGIIIFAAALPLYRIHEDLPFLKILQNYMRLSRTQKLLRKQSFYLIEIFTGSIFLLYGLNILQGIEGENKNSKKSLKDLVTEHEFEKNCLM
ncbi:hypothetical protein S245_033958 [Arachis hypogaea]